VSDVVETEDGYHIIQMIERRGEYINVRHILLQPRISVVEMNSAKLYLDSVAGLIDTRKMTFEEAVVKFSDDPSKNNGGIMINQMTGDSKFEVSQLDPKIFFVVDKLKTGEISDAVIYKTDRGKEEYRLYYLKNRTAPHKANLADDYPRIQELALEKKKITIINDWYSEKAAKTFIKINKPYNECVFQQEWLKKAENKDK
jgi:peptidyl-prolyl cis-trans isomerase SurA